MILARTRTAYAAATTMLLLALLALFRPLFTAQLIGLDVIGGHGLNEIRATYGGLVVTLAVVALWALLNRSRSAPYLRLAGLLWLGAALGRMFSLLIDGPLLPVTFVGLGLELFIGLPLFLASFDKPEAAPGRDVPNPLSAYRS